MNIENLYSKNVVSIKSDKKLKDAISVMIENKYHQLPVIDEEYKGMINIKDIAISGVNAETTKVSKFIVKVPGVSPDEDVIEVSKKLLNNGFRALPVMKDDKVIGIISESDLIKAVKNVYVSEMISRPVITVDRNCTIGKAKNILRDENISRLPIVDDKNKIIGIVSDMDMAKILIKPKDRSLSGEKLSQLNLPVTTIMSKEEYIEFGAPLEKIKEHMKKYDECIFAEDDKPVGIITSRDMIEKLIPRKEQVRVNLMKFNDVDEFELERIKEIIDRFTEKMSKIYKIDSIFFHLKTYEIEGNRKKYSLRGRVYANTELFVAKTSKWSALSAVQDLIEKLERIMKKKHEKEIS